MHYDTSLAVDALLCNIPCLQLLRELWKKFLWGWLCPSWNMNFSGKAHKNLFSHFALTWTAKMDLLLGNKELSHLHQDKETQKGRLLKNSRKKSSSSPNIPQTFASKRGPIPLNTLTYSPAVPQILLLKNSQSITMLAKTFLTNLLSLNSTYRHAVLPYLSAPK